MCRFVILLITVFTFVCGRAQNQGLERLLGRYRYNPAIGHIDMLNSTHRAERLKVAETLDFGDSIYLIHHFVEEYKQIKGYKRLKATKVLNVKGNLLTKMMLNRAIAVKQWEAQNGYKDTVIEFDGCIYAVIHLGGFYKDEEIANYIVFESIPYQKHKHTEHDHSTPNDSE